MYTVLLHETHRSVQYILCHLSLFVSYPLLSNPFSPALPLLFDLAETAQACT